MAAQVIHGISQVFKKTFKSIDPVGRLAAVAQNLIADQSDPGLVSNQMPMILSHVDQLQGRLKRLMIRPDRDLKLGDVIVLEAELQLLQYRLWPRSGWVSL